MVSLPTVSSFFSTCGCFLRGGRSSSGDLPPLSLACGWPPGANGSLPVEWRRLQGFKVEDPSGARKGVPNRRRNWAGLASLGRPAQAQFGPVGRPFALVGPQVIMHFLSYGPPWAHYLGGYQDRLLGGPLGLPGLRCTASEGVEREDYTGVVLG
jgi:hypothetical protein